jgi:hypothetical protein
MREREGLVTRLRQLRRLSPAAGAEGSAVDDSRPDSTRIEALEERIAHLEQLVEGLQDSVHRESERQGKLIAGLQAQIQPAAMGAALSRDARDRGLA